jgi:hypothetical protein
MLRWVLVPLVVLLAVVAWTTEALDSAASAGTVSRFPVSGRRTSAALQPRPTHLMADTATTTTTPAPETDAGEVAVGGAVLVFLFAVFIIVTRKKPSHRHRPQPPGAARAGLDDWGGRG